MKTGMGRYVIVGLGLVVATSAAATGSRSGIVVPPGVEVPGDERAMLRDVIGPRVQISPLLDLSIGTGPCGSPDHAPAAQFPLASLNDLFFCTSWLPVEGVHLQTIEIFAPDGSCYQKLQTPFESPGPVPLSRVARPVKKVTLGKNKVPLEVRTLAKDIATGDYLLERAFPVAGSYIAAQSLVGGWSVSVYLDFDKEPLAAGSFEIVP